MVTNAFGSATSSVAQIDVNGSLTEGLVGWWKFDETEVLHRIQVAMETMEI